MMTKNPDFGRHGTFLPLWGSISCPSPDSGVEWGRMGSNDQSLTHRDMGRITAIA
jgi:hypothetical protein